MNEQKFSTRQAVSLSTLFLIGQVVILYNGMPAKNDIWISVLLAYAVTVPVSLLFARLVTVFPGRNLFDLMFELFGPVFGRVLALCYTLFALHVSSLVLKDSTNFIQTTSLIQTPQLVSAILIGVLCIYGVKAGINTLGRYAALGMPVYLFILLTIVLLSVTNRLDFGHLPPVLYNGFKPVMKSAIDLTFFPYADAVMLPIVLPPLKQHRRARAIFLSSFAISAAFFLLIFMRNVLVLGNNFTYSQYFPAYVATSLIDIADFLQRIEVASGAVLFVGAFVKITVFLYVASLGLSKVLGLGDYRKFSAPVGMLMIALSLFAYRNIVTNLEFATNIYPYYAFPFDVIFPVAIWLTAEWKRKKLKERGQLPQEPPAGTETPIARQDGGAPQNPDGGPVQPQPT